MTKVESSKLGATNKPPASATSTATPSVSNNSATQSAVTASASSNKEKEDAKSTKITSDSSVASVVNSSPAENNSKQPTGDNVPKSNASNSTPSSTNKQDSQGTLTTVELQVLSELDSTQFGFVRLNEESNARKKTLVLKAIKYLERFIVRSRERQRRAAAEPNNNGKNRPNEVNPTLYCKLGHLHLLLENFSKALSAYQTFFRLKKGLDKNYLTLR